MSGDAPAALGLGWRIGTEVGWEVFGLNVALELARRGAPSLALLEGVGKGIAPHMRAVLRETIARSEPIAARVRELVPVPPDVLPPVVLHTLAHPLQTRTPHAWARRNVGVVFFEDTAFDRAALARATAFDAIVVGSTWNAEVLRGYGLRNVHRVVQGVDRALFHPAPRADLFPGRFVVFSGGKLEYRKGQDIVVEAFRRFRARHPEALLVTAWQNVYADDHPDFDRQMWVRGRPRLGPRGWEIEAWLVDNGLPADSVIDLGLVPHLAVAPAIREAHVAVFPNRAESGTNLVAMECMACGIPCILSANTGHRDLLVDDAGFPLVRQTPIAGPLARQQGTDGWCESDPEELVEALERVYTDRAEAERRASLGAALMAREFAWPDKVDELLAVAAA